ncbi:hypothetical protein PQX77_015962 [Marasmius sp. AFHP31]|nr:hypothetical protein PQX77_015962 [Marasmius sp. AFHP31]
MAAIIEGEGLAEIGNTKVVVWDAQAKMKCHVDIASVLKGEVSSRKMDSSGGHTRVGISGFNVGAITLAKRLGRGSGRKVGEDSMSSALV